MSRGCSRKESCPQGPGSSIGLAHPIVHCLQTLSIGKASTQFLPVLTPDGSWLVGPAGTPRARVMALNNMVLPFQNCPSGQQSPVCEGSVGLCKSPCLSWFWPDFSTGWPVLFKNWPGYFKTLFLQREKFLDLWQGKKVLIIIEMTNN